MSRVTTNSSCWKHQLSTFDTLIMDTKQILGLIFTVAGAGALVYGIIKIFEGGEAMNGGSWAATILGLVFFFAGIGLMKSVSSTSSK